MAQPPPSPTMNPVVAQTGDPPANRMPAPQVAAPQGCPPGLEYLTEVDQLIVDHFVETSKTKITKDRFVIKNSLGQEIYFAYEESDFCMCLFCGANRGFIFHIMDYSQQEVMRLVREFKCCAGCGWCACSDSCALEVRVEAPVGNVVGYVKQSQYCLVPQFDILDAERRPVAKIKGSCSMFTCYQGETKFRVFTGDMATTIGKVFKQRPGCYMKDGCYDADNFGVTFPADLHVNMKATLLAAVFLIGYMFYDTSVNHH